MISGSVPKRYARAFMAYARENKLDLLALADEIGFFAGLMVPGSEWHAFLTNMIIAKSRKAEILDEIIRRAAPSETLVRFLKYLNRKGRLVMLPDIAREFRTLADDQRGIVRGEVIVAAELPEKTIEALRRRLSESMAKEVKLSVRKDPAIIGGIVVKVGSLSLDGSIRAQMESIREKLSERVKP